MQDNHAGEEPHAGPGAATAGDLDNPRGEWADLRAGDALDLLRFLPPDSVDAVITDPPYSSGGFTRGDRVAQSTNAKYTQTGTQKLRADFAGDNRDQRSWVAWCAIWLAQCLRLTRPGGYCLVFTDWRQLPAATDALQAGGWMWRGIIVWDKGRAARAPNTAYFRHQCEYILWATKGPTRPNAGGPWDGCIRLPVSQADKHHVTGKPTELMRRLVQVCPPGGVVLDPFMGSGTTGAACHFEGRRFIGCEVNPGYFAVAQQRIAAAQQRRDLTGPLWAATEAGA